MPKIRIDEADALTVADITHAKFTALPATATVGDVRDWFAASTSRRQAFVADEGRPPHARHQLTRAGVSRCRRRTAGRR